MRPTESRSAAEVVKRAIDIAASAVGLLLLSPILGGFCLLIWLEDRQRPLYVADRVGRDGRPFRMVKLRSMVTHADRAGADSTALDDRRITPIGRTIRRFKLDEFSQLWNVLKGDMSLVGPRPNVVREVQRYTPVERRLLSVKPGITDLASIVFADEGRILEGSPDPELRYNQLIRPWKSRLGLHYVNHRSLWLDFRLILVTLLHAASRRWALTWVASILRGNGADNILVTIARRRSPLSAVPPPGAAEVVRARLPTSGRAV